MNTKESYPRDEVNLICKLRFLELTTDTIYGNKFVSNTIPSDSKEDGNIGTNMHKE